MDKRVEGMKYLIESNLEDVIALTETVATEVIRIKPKPRHTYWYIYHYLQALLRTRQCAAAAEEQLREKSAIKIQQFYRKYRGDRRKTEGAPRYSRQSCSENDVSSSHVGYDDLSEEEQAAIKIQQAYRSHQTCLILKREEQQEQEQAAIKIQRAFRRRSQGGLTAESNALQEFDQESTKSEESDFQDHQESGQTMQDPEELKTCSITPPSKSPTKKDSKNFKLKTFFSDLRKRKTYAGVDTHLISPPSAATEALRRQTWAPSVGQDVIMSKSPMLMSVLTKKKKTPGSPSEISKFDSFLNYKSLSKQKERSTPEISDSTSQLMQRSSFGSQPKINSSPILESSTSDLLSQHSPEPQMSDLSSCLNISPIQLARVPPHRKHSVIVSSPEKKSRSASTPIAQKSVYAQSRLSMPVKLATTNDSAIISLSPPPAPPCSPRSEVNYSEPKVDAKVVRRHSSTSSGKKRSSPSTAECLPVPSENKEEISSKAGSPSGLNSTGYKSTPPRQRISTSGKTVECSGLENGIIASPLKSPSFSKNEFTSEIMDINVKRQSSTFNEHQMASPSYSEYISVTNEKKETLSEADLTKSQLDSENLANFSDHYTRDNDDILSAVTTPKRESLQTSGGKKRFSSSEVGKSSSTTNLPKIEEKEDNIVEGGTPTSRAGRRKRLSARLSTTSPVSRSDDLK